MRRIVRYSSAVAVVAAAVVLFAQTASGMEPTTTTGTLNVSGIVLGAGTLCPFEVTLDVANSFTGTTFYDSSGLISRRITTGVEQDTYSANGKTLIGEPYHFNVIADFVDGVAGRPSFNSKHDDGPAARWRRVHRRGAARHLQQPQAASI